MNYGDAPELLDRGDVAMGSKSREAVCVDSPESCLQRIDSAFRFLGAYRVTSVSLNRVSPEQGACEFCAGLSRDLDRDALQAGGSQTPRIEGTSNGGFLLSQHSGALNMASGNALILTKRMADALASVGAFDTNAVEVKA